MTDEEQPSRCDWCRELTTSPLDFVHWPDPDGKLIDVHLHCQEAWLMDKKRRARVVTWERLGEVAGTSVTMEDFAQALREEASK